MYAYFCIKIWFASVEKLANTVIMAFSHLYEVFNNAKVAIMLMLDVHQGPAPPQNAYLGFFTVCSLLSR